MGESRRDRRRLGRRERERAGGREGRKTERIDWTDVISESCGARFEES